MRSGNLNVGIKPCPFRREVVSYHMSHNATCGTRSFPSIFLGKTLSSGTKHMTAVELVLLLPRYFHRAVFFGVWPYSVVCYTPSHSSTLRQTGRCNPEKTGQGAANIQKSGILHNCSGLLIPAACPAPLPDTHACHTPRYA